MGNKINRRDLLGTLAAATTAGVALQAGAQTAGSTVGRTGPRNLITDVPGLRVGSAVDTKVATGTTVIVPDESAVAACDVRGGGPATRETDALSPENLVQKIDGVVFSGGSVYGMAAADGVAAWMGARDRGFAMRPAPGVPPSPILPTACLYDLANGGDKRWGEDPPYRKLGVAALEALSTEFALGTAGAGYGANAGGLKGGLGSASVISSQGFTVGAIAAVNSLGSAIAPGGRSFWAAPVELNDEFGGLGSAGLAAAPEVYRPTLQPRENTTLACIATDVALTRVEAERIAIMAQDGMARALRPAHSPFDGDVVFALSTARQEAPAEMPRPVLVLLLGALAADTLARAIARGVYEATPIPNGNPAWRDLP